MSTVERRDNPDPSKMEPTRFNGVLEGVSVLVRVIDGVEVAVALLEAVNAGVPDTVAVCDGGRPLLRDDVCVAVVVADPDAVLVPVLDSAPLAVAGGVTEEDAVVEDVNADEPVLEGVLAGVPGGGGP